MNHRLTALKRRMYLTNIPDSVISSCLKLILRETLYPDIDDSDSFFSITSTQGDTGLSLVIDEVSLRRFPVHDFVIGPELRAIKVLEGGDAINSVGYIQALATPLSENGINPMYISTYGSDIILVAPDELETALNSLKNVVGNEKETWNEIIEHSSPRKTATSTDCTMAISILHKELTVFSLSTSNIQHSALDLLSFFINPDTEDHFLSYTVTGTEISVLINTSAVKESLRNNSYLEFNSKKWACIQLSEGSSIGESQVSAVANVFAEKGISLYYFSTFANDYTLVPSDNIDHAISVLQNQLGALLDQ